MTARYRIIHLFLCITLWHGLQSQNTSLIIDPNCPPEIHSILNSENLPNLRDSFMTVAWDHGYPLAQLDTLKLNSICLCGPKINTFGIEIEGYIDKNQGKIVYYDWAQLPKQRNKILSDLADRGYPYARLQTLPTSISQDTLIFKYNIDTLQKVFIQDITIHGDLVINNQLFQKMINLYPEQPFSWSKIENAEYIIRSWSFAKFNDLKYDFNPYGVNLEYYLDQKNPSKFDLIIALIPSPLPHKKFDLTGNGYLDIGNQLKMAERIFLKYDKYNNQSQAFDLQLAFPYLPVIRSGALLEGSLDKRDSTYLEVSGKVGIQYQWSHKLSYSIFLQRDQSRLITIDTAAYIRSKQLPEGIDYNWSALGFRVKYNTLNDIQNPRRGSYILTQLTGGLKQNIKNSSLLGIQFPNDDFSFAQLYDEIPENSLKVGWNLHIEKFIPIQQYSTFRLKLLTAWNFGSTPIYENEKLRIGGLQDLRGFHEKQFLANIYSIGSVEYRFLFDATSNIYFFSDFGFLHNRGGVYSENFPYSIGLGLNLGTKAGIFGISYALGGHRGQDFSFNNGRVNFGLVVNY